MTREEELKKELEGLKKKANELDKISKLKEQIREERGKIKELNPSMLGKILKKMRG
jgi:hypothetical protein